MRTLIVYYSMGGDVEKIAKKVGEGIGADVEQLKPVKSISKVTAAIGAATGQGVAIEPLRVNPKDYDQIIIGSPVWAGSVATPVNQFLKEYDVAELVKGIFTSSAGGDGHGAVQKLYKKLPNLKYVLTNIYASKKEQSAFNGERIDRYIDVINDVGVSGSNTDSFGQENQEESE
ncbi:MAG: hypothetical protein K6A30_00750 [Lachnospiraceae bacterium]|nr:hypothetical protein [Lachnospiraceae bacterium]